MRSPVVVDQLPDEQREQPGNGSDGDRLRAELQPCGHLLNYAETMKTGVPMAT